MPINQPQYTTDQKRCRWASFYLVIALIKSLCYLWAGLSIFPAQSWLAVAVYITGLITQHNVTATAIATSVGLLSHDQLSRMLEGLSWGLAEGAILSVRFVEALGLEGYLILDDVLIPKPFAAKIAFCFWDHDHSLNRHCFGQRLVFVVWSNGFITIPLLFAFWQKDPEAAAGRRKRRTPSKRGRKPGRKRKPGPRIRDYSKRARQRRARYRQRKRAARRGRRRLASGVKARSKNEIARCLVWTVVRRGIAARFILFDNWYASADNIALFERLGLSWVTRVKENAKVYLGEQRISVKEVGASVKKANYHYYSRLGARARSFEVKVGDRLVKLVALKDDSHAEGGRTKYLMTNAVSLTTREVVNWYRRRWVIEVFFRDAKQYLGLARSEARREEAVISHVALVCVAYTFLQLVKPVGEQQRASIKASRDAMAVLVVVAAVNVEIARPKPDGEMERISYEHLWHPVRTRLPGAVCPELLDFS